MSEKLTVISHIFNEEYLLPFWLEHHKQIFDHGIIIDYCSTDRSVEIIKKICPTWEIVKTQNINTNGTPNFQAILVDLEVKEIECRINSYKMCLNTTEFLFLRNSKEITINGLSRNLYYHVQCFSIMSTKEFYPKNTVDFFQSIDRIGNMPVYRNFRILHSDPTIDYSAGRHGHSTPNYERNIKTDLFFILWTNFYPLNDQLFNRKLQIQKHIPQADKDLGYGAQHITTREILIKKYNEEFFKMFNIKDVNTIEIKKCIDKTCDLLQ
jgi:hypothetical protein